MIEWAHGSRVQRIELWAWRPEGGAYPGLPENETDAIARRQERIRVTTHTDEILAAGHWAETRPFTIDLRSAAV